MVSSLSILLRSFSCIVYALRHPTLDSHLPRNVIIGFTCNVDVAYFLIDDCSYDASTSGTGEICESLATMFEVWE